MIIKTDRRWIPLVYILDTSDSNNMTPKKHKHTKRIESNGCFKLTALPSNGAKDT